MTKEKQLIQRVAERLKDAYPQADRNNLCPAIYYDDFTEIVDDVLSEIGESVDAAEVVHAEWLDIRFDSMWRSMLATCSHCKVRGEVRVKSNECGFAVPDSDYCPHCGAKMDGGTNK